MTYYPTIEEDLARAKEMLAKAKEELPPDCNLAVTELTMIWPTDSYAAYKLLESFVAEIERLQNTVALLQAQNHRLNQLNLQWLREKVEEQDRTHG